MNKKKVQVDCYSCGGAGVNDQRGKCIGCDGTGKVFLKDCPDWYKIKPPSMPTAYATEEEIVQIISKINCPTCEIVNKCEEYAKSNIHCRESLRIIHQFASALLNKVPTINKPSMPVIEPIKQVSERSYCENSYLTLEHIMITRNQEILNKKLDAIIKAVNGLEKRAR